MTFEEILPGVIVLGLVIAIGIGHLGWRMRERARQPKSAVGTDPPADSPNGTHPAAGSDVHEPGDPATAEPDAVQQHAAEQEIAPQETAEQETVPWKEGYRSLYKNGTWLLRLGWILGIGIVLLWGCTAIGWKDFLLVLGMIIGVPAVLSFVIVLIIAVREESDSGPSRAPWVLGTVLAAGLLLTATHLVVNGLSAREFLDYAHSAQLHVTDSYDGTDSRQSSSNVSGTYLFDGERHHLDRSSWGRPEPVPEMGEVVEISIGPVWPHPTMAGSGDAVRLFLFAAGSGVAGVVALVMSMRGRKNIAARIAEHQARLEARERAYSEEQ
ncbi:hypothetical protein [Saccharomonospora iraqiensis]|uniref:hypothetical protein n=1 Tax=Saccharomonospora iraqiensis TaxID=52698 RepID=UPI00040CC279|nr:hypothetical protein [Saccharomonospora iraqiensis]